MNQSQQRVLVTGATGFTGGALANKLQQQGKHVTALVRKTANTSALEEIGATLVYGDISDSVSVLQAAQGVDIIYHIAAVYRTAGHPDSYYEAVNVGGVQNVRCSPCS